jgi:hypothetical protein
VRWEPDGSPVQWARVVATTAQPIAVHHDDGSSTLIQPELGRAHGDDRGEFLLIVGSLPRDVAVVGSETIALAVQVRARPRPPETDPVDSPTGSRDDPLWHLPVEVVATLSSSDAVAAGTSMPDDYTAGTTTILTCTRGSVTRPARSFVLPVP